MTDSMTPSDRIHVMPTWEPHESTLLCQCEPRITKDGVIVHDARTCMPGSEHMFVNGECAICGAWRRPA